MRENDIILIGPLELEHPSNTISRSRGKRNALLPHSTGGWSFQECILNCCGETLGACVTDNAIGQGIVEIVSSMKNVLSNNTRTKSLDASNSRKAGELFIDQMMFAVKDVLSNHKQIESLSNQMDPTKCR